MVTSKTFTLSIGASVRDARTCAVLPHAAARTRSRAAERVEVRIWNLLFVVWRAAPSTGQDWWPVRVVTPTSWAFPSLHFGGWERLWERRERDCAPATSRTQAFSTKRASTLFKPTPGAKRMVSLRASPSPSASSTVPTPKEAWRTRTPADQPEAPAAGCRTGGRESWSLRGSRRLVLRTGRGAVGLRSPQGGASAA